MHFEDCWQRIKTATPIRYQRELAEIAQTVPSNITKAKQKGIFPPEWAFRIAQKHNLSTDWILTGKKR
ncbi:helix-turn-helix domain-containing protein [Desulfogranum japonicum]|uniref:helix-turn-helix domain-containing protein n=1 Tax=Desulfogranum japonicum TaxID=231447 RepID=UPI0003FD49EE|nr:helix-turn-helix domain-containing protein [Desulfogranum japonicum]